VTPEQQQQQQHQQQQQQQGNYTIEYTKRESNPNHDTSQNPGSGGVPKETEFARVWKLMEVERVQLEREQQHQQEQQQRLELHQQKQVNQFESERLRLTTTTGSTTPIQQQLQQQQGTANSFNIIKYLTYNRDPSPQGVVKERVASFEAPSAVSPPHGVDMSLLASGLPPPSGLRKLGRLHGCGEPQDQGQARKLDWQRQGGRPQGHGGSGGL
jgi:hypothetical protein